MSPRRDHAADQEVRRRSTALDKLTAAIASSELEIPPPVTEIVPDYRGIVPLLPAEAFELARQVYYLQHGSITDAARAIIAAGLSETDDTGVVFGRLKNWWLRREWPKRPTTATFAIRDTNYDGGLFRGRLCAGKTTGNGPAPAGLPCRQSALDDSDFCARHDPRPKYAAQRREHAERFVAARKRDEVPLGPFQQWCERRSAELLEQARATRRVHPTARGWGMLAAELGVDLSLLRRYVLGQHGRHPEGIDTIRASTVVRYLSKTDVTFRDVYGFDPPAATDTALVTCPGCGGRKNHASKVCKTCFDADQGELCRYVNGRGRRCPTRTRHASGYCMKCRSIVDRRAARRFARMPAAECLELLIRAIAHLEAEGIA